VIDPLDSSRNAKEISEPQQALSIGNNNLTATRENEHEKIETLLEAFNADDIQSWKDGAIQFEEYCKQVPEYKFGYDVKGQPIASSVIYLFLREKPAIFRSSVLPQEVPALQQYHFHITNRFIYSQEAVEQIIHKHAEVLQRWGLPFTDADTLMTAIDALSPDHPAIGLLLGFPLSAVLSYEKVSQFHFFKDRVAERLYNLFPEPSEERAFMERTIFGNNDEHEIVDRFFSEQLTIHATELGIEPQQIPLLLDELRYKYQHVHGIHFSAGFEWLEYGPSSKDSLCKQARINAALEHSKILEINAIYRPMTPLSL
jgi:hypothetical protein